MKNIINKVLSNVSFKRNCPTEKSPSLPSSEDSLLKNKQPKKIPDDSFTTKESSSTFTIKNQYDSLQKHAKKIDNILTEAIQKLPKTVPNQENTPTIDDLKNKIQELEQSLLTWKLTTFSAVVASILMAAFLM